MKVILPKTEKGNLMVRSLRAGKPVLNWLDKQMSIMSEQLIFKANKHENELRRKLGIAVTYNIRWMHRNLLSDIESNAICLMGREPNTGEEFTVQYLGNSESLKYFIHLLFQSEPVEIKNLGRCLTAQLGAAGCSLAAKSDLVIMERPVRSIWKPPYGDWMCSPRWVRMVKSLPRGITKDEVKAGYWKYQHTNYYRVGKLGLSRKISRKVEDFRFFYETMHVPTMHVRHGSYGRSATEEYCLSLAQKGFLLWLLLPDGTPIAGSINMEQDGMIYLVMNGILNGDSDWLRKGALAAIYIHNLDYAVEQGFHRVDMGETTPITSDGVFIHKSHWGLTPERSPWHMTEILVWNPNSSPLGWKWMESNRLTTEFATYGGEKMHWLYPFEKPG